MPVRSAAGSDYTSCFRLSGSLEPATARTWAARVFEGGPAWWRVVLGAGWRYGLGLRLGFGGVAGWAVSEETDETVVLAAASRWLSATNTVDQRPGAVSWTTAVTYRGRVGRLLWWAAAPLHHLTIPVLLRRAARVRHT